MSNVIAEVVAMTKLQESVLRGLKARIIRRTCTAFAPKLTREEIEHLGRGTWLVSLSAEVKCFSGSLIAAIGPRGGVRISFERYGF